MRDPAVMSFGDHLEDLRRRVAYALLGLAALTVVFLFLGRPLLDFMTIPLRQALRDAGEPSTMLATNPLEVFASYLKVSIVFALLVGVPWVLYQAWRFVAPGLYDSEKRFVYLLIPLSAVLTSASFLFLYKVLLPISLAFLIAFATGTVRENTPTIELPPDTALPTIPSLAGDPSQPPPGSVWINQQLNQLRVMGDDGTVRGSRLIGQGVIAQEYRVGEYVNLVFWLGLVFALAFQLPLVLLLLSWAGIVEPSDLTPYRRHAVFAAAVAGAIFTPQDPLSMLLLGAALYALFELGLVLMRLFPARRVAAGRTDANEGDE